VPLTESSVTKYIFYLSQELAKLDSCKPLSVKFMLTFI